MPENYQSTQGNYQAAGYENTPVNYQPVSGNYQNESVEYSNNQNEPVSYQNHQTTEQDQPINNYNYTVEVNQSQQETEQSYYETPTAQVQETNSYVNPTTVEKPQSAEHPDLSTLDLLSDIDFSVELQPLTPQIKVPQISENAIKKPTFYPREEVPKPEPKIEEVIQRPAKKELFTDPSLLNKFTEEVKGLQKLVDKLSSKMAGGLTLLDSKWKTFQDVQVCSIDILCP